MLLFLLCLTCFVLGAIACDIYRTKQCSDIIKTAKNAMDCAEESRRERDK